MNYSQSTEDYRQLSVDYSDSNSISESTSLILSNRGHRRGKIFLKDYVYELHTHLFCPLKCKNTHVRIPMQEQKVPVAKCHQHLLTNQAYMPAPYLRNMHISVFYSTVTHSPSCFQTFFFSILPGALLLSFQSQETVLWSLHPCSMSLHR